MPESEAMLGYGTTFALGDGGSPTETFTPLAEVSSLTPPSDTVDQIDVTHLTSPNRTREFIDGFIEPGECTLQMNFIPGSDADDALQAWKLAGGRKNCQITFPNDVTWTFSGNLSGYQPDVPFDDKMTAAVTIKVTSSYTTGVAPS